MIETDRLAVWDTRLTERSALTSDQSRNVLTAYGLDLRGLQRTKRL
jgi:hypothetical protein